MVFPAIFTETRDVTTEHRGFMTAADKIAHDANTTKLATLRNPVPYTRLVTTANQALANATITLVAWSSPTVEGNVAGNMWSAGASNFLLLPFAGVWRVAARVSVTRDGGSTVFSAADAYLQLVPSAGTVFDDIDRRGLPSGLFNNLYVETVGRVTAATNISLNVYVSSGVTMQVQAGYSWFSAEWLSD